MSLVFNFVIIVIVFLIAYWWSNQGFFSGLLHMLAVIIAGAMTFAIWEYLVYDLALGNTGVFDYYLPGLSFVFLFIGLVLIFRVGTDQLIEENLKVHPAVDLIGGFSAGAVAGIIAVGMMLIGSGFIQRPHEFLGYKGFGREKVGNADIGPVGDKMWLPADKLTSTFYEWASITGLRPDIGNTPLRQYNPEMYKQASLLRDTPQGDKGQFYVPPGSVSVSAPMISTIDEDDEGNAQRLVTIPVTFDADARDFGRQLVLSKSQARLIGRASGSKAAPIVYPTYWLQDIGQQAKSGPDLGEDRMYKFDDGSKYVTGVPGREQTKATLVFTVDEDFEPMFIQLKGLRIKLDTSRETEFASIVRNAKADPKGSTEFNEDPGGDISSTVDLGRNIRLLRTISKNKMPGTMLEQDGYLTEGYMNMRKGSKASRISRALQLKGIAQTDGTTIVQIDVSRESPANLFGKVRRMIQAGDRIQLTDMNDNTYAPIGYYLETPTNFEVKLNRRDFLRTLEDLGAQPSSGGGQTMRLIFEVTNGVELDELRVGNVVVGFIEGVAVNSR